MNGYTQKGFLDTYVHYDANGNKTGYSQPGFVGQIIHYDNNGEKTGYSDPAFFGSYVHYDNNGTQTGRSDPAPSGGFFHYDINGNQTGYSVPAPLDGFVHYKTYRGSIMLNIKDYSDVFIIKKERDDYVIKEYIGDIKGTLVIPEGVTKISKEAFNYSWIKSYPEITKIVFPSTLKTIPSCFNSWKHLKEIVIPEGIISIAEHAFFDTGIREVSLPSTIDKIGSGAFALCEDLDRITITHLSSTILNNLLNSEYLSYSNDGEQKLAFSLFFGLSQEIELTEFFRYYNAKNDKFKFTLNNSFVLYGNHIIGYIGNEKHLITPDCAIGVAEEAFINNLKIKSIKLNDKIKSIGNCAFEGCKYLETVNLNETLETIGHFAFADTGIKNITIPPKVKNMGEAVFIDCKHLDTIIITEKLTGDYRTNRWHSNWKDGFYKTPQYKFI